MKQPKQDKSRLFYIVHEFLYEHQAGNSTEMLVWQHKLYKKDTDRWLANAKLISQLTTSKNKPRHNPANTNYTLIPPFPNSHAEKEDIHKLLTHLRNMFKDDPVSARKKLAFLARLILLRTHSSNSAITVRHWDHLQKLLNIVSCFPKNRWRIHIGYQHKSTFEKWKEITKGYPVVKFALTEDKRNPCGQAKVYLSHPEEKQIIAENEFGKYSTNILNSTVRLLVIVILSSMSLRTVASQVQ